MEDACLSFFKLKCTISHSNKLWIHLHHVIAGYPNPTLRIAPKT